MGGARIFARDTHHLARGTKVMGIARKNALPNEERPHRGGDTACDARGGGACPAAGAYRYPFGSRQVSDEVVICRSARTAAAP